MSARRFLGVGLGVAVIAFAGWRLDAENSALRTRLATQRSRVAEAETALADLRREADALRVRLAESRERATVGVRTAARPDGGPATIR